MDYSELIGKKFGRLTFIRYFGKVGRYKMATVKCDCSDNEFNVILDNLLKGTTTSCGCFFKEQMYKRFKKFNTYDLTGEYGIGYASKGEEFYFDLEDYEKIKNHYWRTYDGYIVTSYKNKSTFFHRMVSPEITDKNYVIDHINRDKKDNRKSNLRVIRNADNLMNTTPQSPIGTKGVSWNKAHRKWEMYIWQNNKKIKSKYFINIKDAIDERVKMEKLYYPYRYEWENDLDMEKILKYELEKKAEEFYGAYI